MVGGLSYGPQINRLKRGVDVLIATPGRLVDLMEQKAARLADVEVLVLDEADRMLDMGFWPAMKKIVGATPASRQTLLFSATIDRSVQNSVGTLLRDPAVVEIAHKGETADTVEQFIIRTPQTVKPALLKAVLAEKGAERVIVFARTRSRADATCRRLKRAGYAAEAIHSDRSQNQRRRALDNFAAGKTGVIVATDVLARGIDVEEVDYVVNYDLPTQPEDYVHRIGRTGRAGAAGFAVSFVSPETEDALRDIEKLIKRTIPEMELPLLRRQGRRRGSGLQIPARRRAARPGHPPSRQGAGCAREGERACPQAGEGRLAKGESARVPEAPRQEEARHRPRGGHPRSARRPRSDGRGETPASGWRRSPQKRRPQRAGAPAARRGAQARRRGRAAGPFASRCGRAPEKIGGQAPLARVRTRGSLPCRAFGRPSPVSFPL